MRYTLIRDEESRDAKRLENSDGETIWEPDGRWSMHDDDYLNAIIDDADFGQPQKDALRALLVGVEEEYE